MLPLYRRDTCRLIQQKASITTIYNTGAQRPADRPHPARDLACKTRWKNAKKDLCTFQSIHLPEYCLGYVLAFWTSSVNFRQKHNCELDKTYMKYNVSAVFLYQQ